MVLRPQYVSSGLELLPLDFEWNNEIAVSLTDWGNLPSRLYSAICAINYKACAALTLSSLEWLLWRINGYTDIADPLLRIESAWAMTVSDLYINSLDFDDIRDDVYQNKNPDGPRQTAMCILDYMHIAFKKNRSSIRFIATQAVCLARIVLPASSGYEDWLQITLDSLAKAYPCRSAFDIDSNKYDHSAEPPIPRAWFETLAVPPDEAANRAAWDVFLQGLDPASNPYLVPADEMRANGFEGEPYRMG